MNICTYVTPISLAPKLILVSLYHHTKTLANVREHPRALLQLLTEAQASAVRTCGHNSGNQFDKLARLEKTHQINYSQGLPYFAEAAGFIRLDFQEFTEVGADHTLGIGRVVGSKNLSDAPILTTYYLREHGIIR